MHHSECLYPKPGDNLCSCSILRARDLEEERHRTEVMLGRLVFATRELLDELDEADIDDVDVQAKMLAVRDVLWPRDLYPEQRRERAKP